MTLGIRKLLVIAIVGGIFLTANIMIVTAWLQEHGVIETAQDIHEEFLTGTAITVIIALLVMLVGPKAGRISTSRHRCSVCGHGLSGKANYCGECGSKV